MTTPKTTTLIGDPSQLQNILDTLGPEWTAEISTDFAASGGVLFDDAAAQAAFLRDLTALRGVIADVAVAEEAFAALDGQSDTLERLIAELERRIEASDAESPQDDGSNASGRNAPRSERADDAPAPGSDGPNGSGDLGLPDAPTTPELAEVAPPSGEAGPDDGGVGALGGGFWGWLLARVEHTVNVVDRLTDFIDDYLDRPNLPPSTEAFLENYLKSMDDMLVRLDGFLDVIDAYAPPRFDGWIEHIRDRIEEERDDIDAVLNPPAPVEPPVEEAPTQPDEPEQDEPAQDEPADEEPEQEWTADDFRGEGKTVVVIDTGWNTEFIGDDERPVDQRDFYDTDGGGSGSAQVGDSNDHGSWVDQVVRSVADGVEIIHLKVFPDTGGGAPLSVIENALDWVIDQVEANTYDISAVNLSLGYGNTTVERAGMLSDEFAALAEHDVFSIVAAGNSGANGVQLLAADENTIAVSASTSSNNIAGFSQHHSALTDIFAFGQSVRIEKENGGADVVSGTSFAAPYVSGIAARLQEAADQLLERSLTDDEFIEILQLSGEDLNGYADDDDPAGYHVADADAAVSYFIENYRDYDAVA